MKPDVISVYILYVYILQEIYVFFLKSVLSKKWMDQIYISGNLIVARRLAMLIRESFTITFIHNGYYIMMVHNGESWMVWVKKKQILWFN